MSKKLDKENFVSSTREDDSWENILKDFMEEEDDY